MDIVSDFSALILSGILIAFLAFLGFLMRVFSFEMRYMRWTSRRQKRESKESVDQFTHKHSAHWEYIKDLVSWRIRLRLSRFRGRERALRWRIKVFAFFSGLGPQVAQWILEEYMIADKIEERPASTDDWLCAKCGAYNPDTALFCKDCGEYK